MKNASPFLFLLVITVLSSCASVKRPAFQKWNGENTYGYKIEPATLLNDAIFKAVTVLPPKVEPKFAVYYGTRAVAEECSARGYDYFDIGIVSTNEVDGYCYKTADHKGLGVTFSDRGLEANPKKLVVASLNDKKVTKLQKGDEIMLVDGQKVSSLAQIKRAVAALALDSRDSVDLEIKRHDQIQVVKEPLALFKNSAMDPHNLELLRR